VPDLHLLGLFMAAALALNLTPGPDMLYTAARSSSEGVRAGVVSALGVAAGIMVHTAAVALGVAALLIAVPVAYDAIRIAGAIYLAVLGLQLLLKPKPPGAPRSLAPARLRAVFLQGVVTNVLNPKVALFFLAFLPQFVDPAAGSAMAQLLLLGLLFNAQGTLVNLAVAVFASRITAWLRASAGGDLVLQRATGAVFVALGMRLAASVER